MPSKKKKQRGRPKGHRQRFEFHMKPKVVRQIDKLIEPENPELSSRGRVVEHKFSISEDASII